ncbi:MAG: M28 family peptidase [Vicingaceae bacterium]
MKNYKLLLTVLILFIGLNSKAQSYNNFYGDIVNNYSADTVYKYLVEFESLGVKEHNTAALQNTLDWLIEKYTDYGYTDIQIDTFNYAAADDYNLIVTKQGSVYPNTYVIIDGHYDTRAGTGTNDNGTGISIILEVARLLQDINTEYSIKFINFSGEEDGLIGSTSYVNNVVVPTNMDIKIVFNIDEVGGINGIVNNTIVCERDQATPTVANAASYAYTDTLATCIELYSNLLTEISYAYSSDYMPFQAEEKVITGIYEKNESPYNHTPNDSLSRMDPGYVYEITQGTIGAALYFSAAREFAVGIDLPNSKESLIEVFPNPTKNNLIIDFKDLEIEETTIKIYTVLGELILTHKVKSKQEKLKLQHLTKGIYTLSVKSPNYYLTEKIVVQ